MKREDIRTGQRVQRDGKQYDIHNHPARSTRDVAVELRNRMRGGK